jgi:O-antigen/teichoic acid export membrane protein
LLLPRLRRPENGAAAGYGLFFAAYNVANILNYAFLLAMSRVLAPGDFALFAALFGAVYLASALANTAQTSVAAAVAAAGRQAGAAVVGDAMRRLVVLALPIAGVVLLAARPFAAFLHSDDLTSVGLTGVAIWLFLLAAVGYGGLQGSGRFRLLGAGLLVASVGRLALGLGFLWLGLGVSGALLGIVVGLGLSAALVVAPFVRSALRPAPGSLPALPAVVVALLASVAIAVPTSVDVVLARHYFTAEEAGAYAAVSVLGKVVVFGPLAISLIFFPLLVRRQAEGRPTFPLLRLNLLATAVISAPLAAAVVVLGVYLPEIILRGYSVAAAFLATYLAAMLVFSLVVVLLYFNLAQRRDRLVGAVPLALAAQLAVIMLWHPGAFAVALVLLTGNLLVLFASLWASLRPAGGQVDDSLRQLAPAPAAALHD